MNTIPKLKPINIITKYVMNSKNVSFHDAKKNAYLLTLDVIQKNIDKMPKLSQLINYHQSLFDSIIKDCQLILQNTPITDSQQAAKLDQTATAMSDIIAFAFDINNNTTDTKLYYKYFDNIVISKVNKFYADDHKLKQLLKKNNHITT